MQNLNLRWQKCAAKMKKLNYLILILLVQYSSIIAQTSGSISGTVVDKDFGDPLIGVNVFIEGTTRGSATDIDGKYSIDGIEPGTYNVTFSIIGFQKNTITGIEIKPNANLKIDAVLGTETYETEEVIISAKALTNTEASLLANRQKSIAVSDAISAEEISKSGSGDAASAMKKVTGASVVGGKYVYIRGLGERYSATMLNGAELPSADPDKKSFQLDLIPGNMLNNINTIKTFTPDKPGSFTGGLVDVTLKSYPENLSINLSSSVGYNSLATGNSNFILGNSGGSDYLGFDDGTRELPSSLNGGEIDIPRTSTINTKEDALYLDGISKSFNDIMAPVNASAPVNSSFSLSIGNTIPFDSENENSLGFFGSFSYGQNYSFVQNGEIGRYKLVGSLSDVTGLEAEFKGSDTKGNMNIDWGAIGNVAYKNNSLGELKFSYMRTQSANSLGRYMVGVRDRDRSSESSTVTFETRVVSWTERALDNYQFEGDHSITALNNLKLDWKVSYSLNTQDEPDQRYFFNIFRVNDDGSKTYAFDGANSQPLSRYFRDLEETNFSTQLNLTMPFKIWDEHQAKLKTGLYTSNVDRGYNQKRFDYETNRLSFNDYNGDIQALFNDVGIIDSVSRPDRPSRWFGLTLDNESVKDSTNYFRGDSKILASYLMIDLPIINQLRFIGGARLETTLMNSGTLDVDDEKGKLDNTDILPSLNLIYAINENMNFRLAYTNTIARPTFRELAPYLSFEFVGDFLYMGNPNLKRTLITNYDLRWEWFLNPGEIIALSGFYKDFNDPIESYIDPTFSDDNTLRSVKNVDRALVYGLEFEFRKGLGFISSDLENFKIGSNLSLVESKVDVPQEEIDEKIYNGDPNPDKTRPFVGQSPYLFNVNLTYDNFESNTSAGIFYTLFGDRLFVTGRHATPDVYERGYGTLDFKVTQGIFSNFDISLSAKNILDPEQIFSYKLDNGLVNKEFNYSAYKQGTTFSISLSYKP
ncbi:MAG: TonB-dependent receptor [Ignavibacteriae bacterium]|nr:TonB-dependent receptor [Ignavibacteriota bacterium]MCB9260310.1 TonB-dependent receptor [Ignavibacteriales bacterium]